MRSCRLLAVQPMAVDVFVRLSFMYSRVCVLCMYLLRRNAARYSTLCKCVALVINYSVLPSIGKLTAMRKRSICCGEAIQFLPGY